MEKELQSRTLLGGLSWWHHLFYLFGSKSWIEAWKFSGLLAMVVTYCLKARTKAWRQFPSGLICINPNNSGLSEAWWHEIHSRYLVKIVFILIHGYVHISPLCHSSPVLWFPYLSLSCSFFRELASPCWEAEEKTTEKLISSVTVTRTCWISLTSGMVS